MQLKMPNTYLREALLACRKAFLYVAVFSCFVNMLTLTVSLYMLQIFDRVLASRSYDTLIYLTVIAIFALGILAILDALRSRILVFLSHWLDNKLSPEALQRSVDNLLQGETYAPQSLRDIAQIRGFLTSPGMTALLDSPWVPFYLFVIFILNPFLGLMATVGAILLIILAIINEKSTRDILTAANAAGLKSQYHINVTLRNSETIQAMGMLPDIIDRWFVANEKVLALQALANKRSGIILSVSKFLRFTIQVLMLGLGAYFVVTNRLTSGSMIAASIILSRALAPIEQAIGVWNQFTNTRSAYNRLENYFERPLHRSGEISLPRPKGQLSVENVSLIPPGSQSIVLKNISFELQAGEMLAIIGPSAAGKTSLARLLVGAWAPSGGHVRLDSSDVYSWNRVEFGQYIGYLPQSIELFTGTIKENIGRMRTASDDEIIQASQMAGAHDMILHLPDGYDTVITESGSSLSGGQRQRVALARAMFGNPAMVVLDEPNSNLDTEGEEALLQALNKARALGTTVIFITHRPNIVAITDKILVLQQGSIQLYGPKAAVFAKLQEIQTQRMASSQHPKET